MRRVGPAGLGGGGIGMILVILVVSWLTGTNPLTLLEVVQDQSGPAAVEQPAPAGAPASDPEAEFIKVVLADLEDTWGRLFQASNSRYEPPVLVLFTGEVSSACGSASSAVGPFYCPGDQKVYLDLGFFRELSQRFGAPGDFAQAYVVAHEVGHHVQHLTGVNAEVSRLQRQSGEAERNTLSVRLELQADCYAGVWGHHAGQRQLLDPGDVEEGLTAAAAIGDDRLQREGRGRVVPESFTHGTSAQRAEWLRRGIETGRVDSCNTLRGVS